jgi:hypothetical protein
VEFDDIRFAYPARPNVEIFKGNFKFKGKANQTIALVVSCLFTWKIKKQNKKNKNVFA